MKLERAQKIIESIAKEERNFAYGDWDRAEAICTVLIDIQKELAVIDDLIISIRSQLSK